MSYKNDDPSFEGSENKWTIGKKLAVAFAGVAIITLILGSIGYYGATQSDKIVKNLGGAVLPSVQSLQNMNIAVVEIYAAEQALQNKALSRSRREQIYKDVNSGWDKFQKWREIYHGLPQSASEAAGWQELLGTLDNWKEDYEDFIALSKKYDSAVEGEADEEMVFTEIRDQFLNHSLISYDNMHSKLAELVRINEGMATKQVETANTQNEVLKSINIIGLLVGVLASALLGYFITGSVNKALRNIISRLNSGSEQVNAASEQLSGASQELAESASEQAASLQETTSSLEEMSSQIKQNAENSGEAENAMNESKPLVENGVNAMRRMSQAMEEITNSSKETSKIIKTIDDIAFQTNLLALNAAVEAARAGEAGKGFAVVAEEVRNLAQRSAEAAQDTSELIQRSQASSDRGSSVAGEVSENLEKIEQSISNVSGLVAEISAASKEQAIGIQQMNSVMGEMDEVVQSNASSSEESASAAEELSSQAVELKYVVNELKELVGQGSDRSRLDNNILRRIPTIKNGISGTAPSKKTYQTNGHRNSFQNGHPEDRYNGQKHNPMTETEEEELAFF